MINIGRIEMVNEMVVIAIPIPGENPNDYQYQVRWVDGPVFYKRKIGDVQWSFTTSMDFIKNVKSHNLIDWKQAPSKYQDSIEGGVADSTNPLQYNPIELEKGIKVEMEHTNNQMLATEIAMDHLMEDPDYYNKLEQIHERVQKRGNKWVLLSKKGKVLGTHDTKKEALNQEKAIWASYR